MAESVSAVPLRREAGGVESVEIPLEVCFAILHTAQETHRNGLKSFGLLVARPDSQGYPFVVDDFVFLDPRRNRRNDPRYRSAFRAQGAYFRRYDDAGFVADPSELLQVVRRIEDSGLEIVAPFHTHRRQPANFSTIDYRLHNPAYAWHLIISLRRPKQPRVRAFRISKPDHDFGVSEHDRARGSELAYEGPEVAPLGLITRPRFFPAIRRLPSGFLR